ncbi:hypothetical protein OMP40_08560 [Cohnella rhizosphaerae]|uniref:Fumarate reductase/succinate dehydrogenase flavoprotein-like C-terminal domain-containing protein n=1 Tax=Cohnella rhizosphaerae TaxID=1457232 RepID=A0A9X4KWQ8_9BACL|nr:hypothetical protein [Cohnella rhizosphaerae]MDG0809407.1 hypothetical protein [Cohnella rhizosphaerae]
MADIQRDVLPLNINFYRSEPGIAGALGRLDALREALRGSLPGTVQGRVRVREAAGMLAVARWMYTAALARKETRGLAALAEYPALDPKQTHRLILSGIEDIAVGTERAPHAGELGQAKVEAS